MKINPLNYIVEQPKRVRLTDVSITNVYYNNPLKTCNVTFNGEYMVVFQGTDYDALGQWTDDSLLSSVLTKIGATPDTSSNTGSQASGSLNSGSFDSGSFNSGSITPDSGSVTPDTGSL